MISSGGGIGRHEGLKIPCLYGRAGSTPAPSTKKNIKKDLADWK